MRKEWTAEAIQDIGRGYQRACVLAAGVELDVFSAIGGESLGAKAVCAKLGSDLRGTTILLDALAANGWLVKKSGEYSVSRDVAALLTEDSDGNILAGLRLQANCMRWWVQLAAVAQSGKPAERVASIRGAKADQEAFIGAMHVFSGPMAKGVVAQLGALDFGHLLDIGGGSGTWTMALLDAVPRARATLFDLPEVIPLAEARLEKAGLSERVRCVAGDFYTDQLPKGADFALLSAIAHQNSREQNRALFAKTYDALENGGVLVIRDVVMDETRTQPVGGAMFAVNMLVATERGGTYTFAEFAEDLASAGFGEITLVGQDEFMNSLVRAVRG